MKKIREITSETTWEKFLIAQPETPFFQSWAWGEVQSRLGLPILRLGIYEDDSLISIAQIIKVSAKRGTFFHVRHGPVLAKWNWNTFDQLLHHLVKIGKQSGVHFIRFAPLLDKSKENRDEFAHRGFYSAPIHNMDAENAWIVPLGKSEEELLAQMRKTTRYLVRKGEKMGIEIEKTVKPDRLNVFLKLYRETARRQGFVPHRGIPEEYELLGKKDHITLFLAHYKGKVISGALIIFYGKEAVYHHSGMEEASRDIPASYLIQWEAIKEAKRRGKQVYNLWGISPADKPNHPWRGLAVFKMGFGGMEQTHIHAQDFPLSSRYWLTYGIETIRRIKRGY